MNFFKTGKMRVVFVSAALFSAFCLMSFDVPASGSDSMMKGPETELRGPGASGQIKTSSAQIALLGMIKLYQRYVSPIGGVDRCGFRPSCSQYGYAAIKEQGPIIGIMMIGDRQTRCTLFKEPGPDYMLLPNGKLFDPISKNLLFEK